MKTMKNYVTHSTDAYDELFEEEYDRMFEERCWVYDKLCSMVRNPHGEEWDSLYNRLNELDDYLGLNR